MRECDALGCISQVKRSAVVATILQGNMADAAKLDYMVGELDENGGQDCTLAFEEGVKSKTL